MSKKNLVIVESPAKAKTIEKYLGSDFKVLSSIGHIRSIAKKAKKGAEPIDVENDFKTLYEIDSEKKKVITELKKAVKDAESVWLATDEDREGEAIAWHLCEVLGLDAKKTKRIVFHEITKGAIDDAVKHPRTVDMNLVQAQQARQILDRLVGFELSPVVWQKVPGGKSAGRVQSPAVRLLVEREREIQQFEGSSTFKITAEFDAHGSLLKAELPKRFDTEKEAESFLRRLQGNTFKVSDVTTSPSTRSPAAPFTTSTLQQEANSRLGFGAKATMSSAQKLYQEGKITYMRTDSMNLSDQAIAAAAEYIKSTFGEQYVNVRKFKTKSAGAQEAHEAIRPTDMRAEKGSSNEYDQRLYQLIRNRTLASQMAPAKLEKTTITISIANNEHSFEAKGEVIIFDGFLKVYGAAKKDVEILPAVKSGEELSLKAASARQTYARPPARYSEGALVKKLEDLGIGRPSTYATIINTVQERGYALKGEGEGAPRDVIVLELGEKDVSRQVVQEKTGADRGKLIPTTSGQVVSDFLTNHFDSIVDYGFTASVEAQFDDIAKGALERNRMLKDFYTPFHERIEQSGGIKRSEVAQARVIGTDPKSGKTVSARLGRFGPMVQLGDADKDSDEKPQFAGIPSNLNLDTITLDEALKLFELPRSLGLDENGNEIIANTGRFGPYVKVGSAFVSIKGHDPHTIDLPTALELIKAHSEKRLSMEIKNFEGTTIRVLKGRFGPYITDGKKNAKIPKDTEPEKLTLQQCEALLKEAPAKKGRFVRRKKA